MVFNKILMSDRAKILFVDDDPLMHLLYRPHIERAGYEVLGARDGAEAIPLASREEPQLVVLDMMMPEVDGVATLLELKRSHLTRSIPIIAVSANTQYYGFRNEVSRLGGDAFLLKPFSPAQLVTEIRRLAEATRLTFSGNHAKPGMGHK
jgi:DNA-binding response OmpR family regulator